MREGCDCCTAVLAAVDGQVERQTVAEEDPGNRRAVVVERRFTLDLGMVYDKKLEKKTRRLNY